MIGWVQGDPFDPSTWFFGGNGDFDEELACSYKQIFLKQVECRMCLVRGALCCVMVGKVGLFTHCVYNRE